MTCSVSAVRELVVSAKTQNPDCRVLDDCIA